MIFYFEIRLHLIGFWAINDRKHVAKIYRRWFSIDFPAFEGHINGWEGGQNTKQSRERIVNNCFGIIQFKYGYILVKYRVIIPVYIYISSWLPI